MISVVTVHGLWMRGNAMAVLQSRLAPRGFELHAFAYRSITSSLAECTAALAEYAEQGRHLTIESQREDSLEITFRLDDPETYHELLSKLLGAALGVDASDPDGRSI